MRRSRAAAVLCTFILLGAAACGSDDDPPGFTGRWDGPDDVELTLEADGTATGSDGCNSFGATWEATSDTEGTIKIGRTTLKACEGVGWTDPAQLTIVDDELVVKDSSGKTLSTLEPDDD